MRSRYNLGEDHMREKKKYAVKEREEVVKKAREQRVAEIKVGHYLGKFVVGRGRVVCR